VGVTGARCPKISTTDVNTGGSPCNCGCVACLATCDGYGPVVGVVIPGDGGPVGAVVVSVTGLPSTGRLGMYARARGLGTVGFNIVGTSVSTVEQLNQLGSPSADPTFTELRIAPQVDLAGRDGKAQIAVAVFTNQPEVVEIDCIVPVVVP
jgi:hypothetical protein